MPDGAWPGRVPGPGRVRRVSEQQMESTPFQVHLRGVVELLSRSIYSGPAVYLRELIQNAADAIAARLSACGRCLASAFAIGPLRHPRAAVRFGRRHRE